MAGMRMSHPDRPMTPCPSMGLEVVTVRQREEAKVEMLVALRRSGSSVPLPEVRRPAALRVVSLFARDQRSP